MIPETGTRHDFKQCVLTAAAGLPVEGYVYRIPDWVSLVAVLAVDRHWVHIVSVDLESSTSYYLEQWLAGVTRGQIERTDDPWRDLSEIRKNLFM